MNLIHITASVHSKAKLHPSVRVGPFAVIDEDVEIGADCIVGPHVHITGVTTIGTNNRFHTGCVIGDAPQDLKYDGTPTKVRIGNDNVFREHVTVHRATKPAESTIIGSHNFLMANAHVAHNCVIGDRVIIANGALLGGHAVVQDRAFISGNCLVHQFTRVGTLAIMQGGAGIGKDLPPFTIATGVNEMCGLNTVGLRRAGFTPQERLELKSLYRVLFRNGQNLKTAMGEASGKFFSAPARTVLDFIAAAKRGVCADVGSPRPAVEASEAE